MGHGFEMIRIAAPSDAAEVIYFERLGNISLESFVCQPMGPDDPPLDRALAVTELVRGALPDPAWRRVTAILDLNSFEDVVTGDGH
jgi:hypothetical protein